MEKFDDIVVGSGISGLSMTQLLALSGRRVLLLEKAAVLGGSLARFTRQGVPCDTGFHFTAGLGGDNPMLLDMLEVLNIRDAIKPLFIPSEKGNRVIFGDSDIYELPMGVKSLMESLCKRFPDEKQGIVDFFELAKRVCDNTPLFDIRNIIDDIPIMQHALDEDFISLADYLDEHIKDANLKGVITSYSMCYGVSPHKVSLANHCRICFWLFDSIARVDRGGDAFIDAFKQEFEKYDVTVKKRCYIERFDEIEGKTVKTLQLNTGERIAFENCILSIHPKDILKLLSAGRITKAFRERVEDFEETLGFFSVYGYLENMDEAIVSPSLTSVISSPNYASVMDANTDDTGLVIMTTVEEVKGVPTYIVNAFETSHYSEVERFDNEALRHSDAYKGYKQQKAASIIERMYKHHPEFKDHFKLLNTASVLTFKDYLNSPFGSAYGIEQKLGQFSLFGRLPLRNVFAVGQSAMLPGVLGAMMSSFIVLKNIVGKEVVNKLINEKLKGRVS